MAQLQHNMWVTNARSAALSIITGGGKWIEMAIPADALYQHFLITAERGVTMPFTDFSRIAIVPSVARTTTEANHQILSN